MSVTPILMPASSASAPRAVAPVRAPSNAASSGTFHGESADDRRAAQRRIADRHQPDLSRNDTTDFAPVWHGPLLKPTFVAQVLGQILMDKPALAGPSSVYRGAQIARGLVVDRDV